MCSTSDNGLKMFTVSFKQQIDYQQYYYEPRINIASLKMDDNT